MFTEPKRTDGLKEPKMSYDTKRLWAIVSFYDFYDEITFKKFIQEIEHFIKIYDFPWEYDTYPNYGTASNWSYKYDYQECVECYEDYQLNNSHKKAQKLYDKRYFNDTTIDYQRLDETAKNIDTLRSQSSPNVYALAKEEETYDRIFNRIQERLGRRKETYKVEAEVESTGETQLNINGNLSVEDKLEKYETYFKSLNSKTESNTD